MEVLHAFRNVKFLSRILFDWPLMLLLLLSARIRLYIVEKEPCGDSMSRSKHLA